MGVKVKVEERHVVNLPLLTEGTQTHSQTSN